MFKVSLPNPSEMSIPQFCSQMRVAIKAIEKSYEEMAKEDEINKPFLMFRLSVEMEKLLEKSKVKHTYNGDEINAYDAWSGNQELSLELNIV